MRKHFAILVILVAAIPALGGTLADFKNYLTSTKAEVDALVLLVQNDRAADGIKARRAELVKRLREPGAALRLIEFAGSSIEVDYGWFAVKADAIEKGPDAQLAVIEEVGERIDALLLKITELEEAQATGLTKDESKQKLGEILSRIEFQKPAPPEESLLDRIARAINRWLDEVFPRVEMPADGSEGMRSTSVVLQFVLYAFVIGVVGYLLFRFSPFLVTKLRRRRRESAEDRVIMGDRIGFEENAGTLFGEAELLARNGDLRGAVRKGYIALLCELSDRKLVGLARHKTNRDYLRDVRKHRTLFQRMNDLTGSFERHWYGFEETTSTDWEEFRDGYRQTMESSRQV